MKVLFVFAHPDDETFSSWGTIKLLSKQGIDVRLVVATRGEEGQLGDPPLCTREELGVIREKELRAAARILGVSNLHVLNYRDSTLQKIPIVKLEYRIALIIHKVRPDVVITFDKQGVSNHPDHIAVSQAATSAFKKYKHRAKKHVRLYYVTAPLSNIKKLEKAGLSYNAFGKMKGTPDGNITTVIDVAKTLSYKINALREHKTQRKDWERFLRRKDHIDLGKEYFMLVAENSMA